MLTQARRFEDLKVDHEGKEIEDLAPLETAVRPLAKLAPAPAAGGQPTLTLVETAPTSADMSLRRILTVDADLRP